MDDIEYNRQMEYDMMMNELLSMGEDLDEYQKTNTEIIEETMKDVVIAKIPKNKTRMFPITTDEKNIQDKKCDYQLLFILTLLSRHSKGENHRYIFKDDIVINKELIEKYSKRKINTIIKNIRKLSKLEGNAVIGKIVNDKIVYIINYENEQGRKYVLLEETLMKYLVDTSSSNLIKIYLLLRYRCNDKNEKKITRKSLAEGIGLNSNSGENLMTITNIIKDLKAKNLIEVNKKFKTTQLDDGNFKHSESNYIKLINYNDWLKWYKK